MRKEENVEVVTVTLNPAIDQTLEIPDFGAGRVNRVAGQARRAGGKGVNVAAALAAAGRRVAATGFLGRANDALFTALLTERGIADRFVRLEGETRVGIKIFDPAGGETTDINFPGLAPDAAALDELFAALRTPGGDAPPWFVLAGSLPPGVAPTFYHDAIQTLKERGARVALDTSGDAFAHALAAAPHLVKPNVDELEAVTGERLATDAAVVEAARRLLAQGVETAVVSMGGRGAIFVCGDEALLASPPRVAIGSSVGAGDAMVAGLVAAQLDRLPLAAAARLATAFSLAAIASERAAAPLDERLAYWTEKVEVSALHRA